MKKLTLIMGCSLLVFVVKAQSYDAEKVVRRLADIMNKNYVYPDKGAAMHDLVLEKLENGGYAAIESPNELAETLDRDLKLVIYDKHIRVQFDPKRVEAIRNRDPHGGREPSVNLGFEEVKILEDNIGYLDLRGFADVRAAEDVAVPAMDKLIKADAIIFDLRKNGGGSPSMVRFICSYLFEERTHLNTFYWRPDDRYSETWTNPDFASQIKPDIPVYILTSSYTFSAAEEFTYDLKNLKRATVIGEVTGGGAHPGGPMLIADGFLVNVPQGRAINPVTKTNWEGVGVSPDIEIPSDQALEKALTLARKAISTNK